MTGPMLASGERSRNAMRERHGWKRNGSQHEDDKRKACQCYQRRRQQGPQDDCEREAQGERDTDGFETVTHWG